MTDECCLEELTAFLEETPDEEDSLEETPNEKDAEDCLEVHGTEDMQSEGELSGDFTNADPSDNHTATPASCTKIKQLPSKEDIQAELMAMQKRMLDLQNLLNEQNNDVPGRKKDQRLTKPCLTSQNPTANTHSKSSTLHSTSNKQCDTQAGKPGLELKNNKDDVHKVTQLGNDPFGDSDSDWGDFDEVTERQCLQVATTKTTATNSHLKNSSNLHGLGSPEIAKPQNTVEASKKGTSKNSSNLHGLGSPGIAKPQITVEASKKGTSKNSSNLHGLGSPGIAKPQNTVVASKKGTSKNSSNLHGLGSPGIAKPQNTVEASTKGTSKNSSFLLSLGSPGVAKPKNTVELEASKKGTHKLSDGNSWLESDPNNTDDAVKGKELARDLFGDSDSDWEDMDGEEKRTLTSEGNTIRKIIKSGARERTSHVSQEYTNSQAERPTWKSNPKVSSTSIQKSSPTTHGKKNISEPEEKFVTDSLTGIRIVKPLVSSTEMARKMQDRKIIRMSRLHLKIKTPDVQGNWVTIGVIVHKTDPKTSATGKVYTIWKMCDLEDCERIISFFLFGQVYKEHWKTSLGMVVGLLNPSIMDNADKGGPEVAFTINNPQQLLLMGQSKDLGWCRGKTRKGNSCTNFVSKKFGDFCSYHVQSAYRKASAKRSELQGSFTGTAPKSFEQKLMKSGGHFMYGGQTFLSSSAKPRKNTQGLLTVKKLQSKQHTSQNDKKVTTMSLHELAPGDADIPLKKPGSGGDETFMELVSTPSIGSMNLVKHLIKQEKSDKVQNEKIVMKSITPKELLHEHRRILKEKQKKKQQQTVSPSSNNPMSTAPVLGKGFYPGGDIFLDCSPSENSMKVKNQSVELSKRRAVAKVRANGGIVKEDPNAVKKILSPDRIKKRVRKNIDDEPKEGQHEEPPAKRSKLLGNVDLNSEEIKKLMKARSSHKGALAKVEAEKEEKYFDELEKKEKMEEKMLSITELKTTVFTCKQCQYTAFSLGETCKRERHNVVRHTAMKRFFKCKDCKNRSVAITKYPIHPCKNCNGNKFERTSMVKEKTGPKLDSEILCLRGDEVKFLNSLQENVF